MFRQYVPPFRRGIPLVGQNLPGGHELGRAVGLFAEATRVAGSEECELDGPGFFGWRLPHLLRGRRRHQVEGDLCLVWSWANLAAPIAGGRQFY